MGTARKRAAEGRGERRREGTRAHCRARLALCPSLAADGLSRRPHVAPLPRRYAAAPRRLTHGFRTPEPSFPSPLSRSAGESQSFPGRRRPGPAEPGLVGARGGSSRAAWIARPAGHSREGLPTSVRGVGRVYSHRSSGERRLCLWSNVGCQGGWSQRVGAAFGLADCWGTASPPLTLLGCPDGKTRGAPGSGPGRRPQHRGLARCSDTVAPSGYMKTHFSKRIFAASGVFSFPWSLGFITCPFSVDLVFQGTFAADLPSMPF